MTTFKTLLIAGVSTLAFGASAGAQSVDDLEARLAALEAMVADLRGALDEARAQTTETEDRIVRLETQEPAPAPAAAAAPAAPSNGFMVGNTRVTYGGFVDLDVHVSSFSDGEIAPTSVVRDFYIPGATPVGGTGDDEADIDFTAKSTRFSFTTTTPSDLGDITGKVEFDFLLSPGGDERVSNSYNPRLRLAYLNVGAWRFGQDWSTFQNLAAIPESASFLVANDGMIFVRQALLRYSNGPLQLSLENADTTVTPYRGGSARIDAGDGMLPDFVARYNFTGEGRNIAVAALARRLVAETGGIDGEAFGWGLSVQGKQSLGANTDVRFSLTAGEGVGRYIGINAVNGAVATASGDIEAIPVVGGLIALRHALGGGRSVSLGVSALEADNDVSLTGLGATAGVRSAFGAYTFQLVPGVMVGTELMFGERELENGQTGSLTRATFSTRYSF